MTVQALDQNTANFAPAQTGWATLRGSRMAYSRAFGALFPLGFLCYGTGFALVMSVVGAPDFLTTIAEHRFTLIVGAFLMLLNTAVDIGKAVLAFPILEAHSKRTAVAYLAAMTLEVALMAVGIVCLLMLLPLGAVAADIVGANAIGSLLVQSNGMAYQIAMLTLAVANVVVWSLTFRVRLLPRWLSLWGIIGYIVLTAGTVAELFGIPLSLLSTIPGGLFEIGLGAWLIVMGFEPAAYAKTVV